MWRSDLSPRADASAGRVLDVGLCTFAILALELGLIRWIGSRYHRRHAGVGSGCVSLGMDGAWRAARALVFPHSALAALSAGRPWFRRCFGAGSVLLSVQPHRSRGGKRSGPAE